MVNPSLRNGVFRMDRIAKSFGYLEIAIKNTFDHPPHTLAPLAAADPQIIIERDNVGDTVFEEIRFKLVLRPHNVVGTIVEFDPRNIARNPFIIQE